MKLPHRPPPIRCQVCGAKFSDYRLLALHVGKCELTRAKAPVGAVLRLGDGEDAMERARR